MADTYPGLQTQPVRFRYYPEDPAGYLNHWRELAVYDRPCFALTTFAGFPITDEEWMTRDTVRGLGSHHGTAIFAELLLNASYPQNTITEYSLESDAGYGGGGRRSAEATFFLPGSLGWIDSAWPSSASER